MTAMGYRRLGRSGLRVAEVALGTMTFGATTGWGVAEDTARALYTTYREAGGNYIDTANQYAYGESERIVGDLVAGHRDEVVIATKYTNAAYRNGDANAGGNQRKNMRNSIEQSLRRLRTDHVDLYVVHAWDLMTPVEEVLRGLDDLVRSGKVLHVAISNTPAWVVAKSTTMAELRGWTSYVGLQVEYSLLARTPETDLLPMAADQGLSVLAWSPLKNGLLTGKHVGGVEPGSRLAADLWNSPTLAWTDPRGTSGAKAIAELVALASELEVAPAQLALAWLLHRPVHVVPVLGATRVEQLAQNLASVDLVLTAEQVARLDAASAVPLPYPHHYLASDMARSFRSGGMADRIRS